VRNGVAGRASLGAALQGTGDKNLSVLTPGQMPPSPSERLGSQSMTDLIALFSDDHDWIVVDSPPLLAVADAAATARCADGVLVVTRAGVSTHPAAVYDELLTDVPGIEPASVAEYGVPVYHLYIVKVESAGTAERVVAALTDAGVGTALYYPLALPWYRA
jgi:cellulose biosynthesis protein BcsQ